MMLMWVCKSSSRFSSRMFIRWNADYFLFKTFIKFICEISPSEILLFIAAGSPARQVSFSWFWPLPLNAFISYFSVLYFYNQSFLCRIFTWWIYIRWKHCFSLFHHVIWFKNLTVWQWLWQRLDSKYTWVFGSRLWFQNPKTLKICCNLYKYNICRLIIKVENIIYISLWRIKSRNSKSKRRRIFCPSER